MIPQLMEELKKANAEDITVIIGGVIPKQDYQFLLDANVKGIFGPGTPIPKAASEVMDIIDKAV
jgi:methylmalonyl-CoA mutase